MKFKKFEKYGPLVTHLDLADFLESKGERKNAATSAANAVFWQLRVKLKVTTLLVCIDCAKQAGKCACEDQFSSAKWMMPVKELLSLGYVAALVLSPRPRADLLAFQKYWQRKARRS